VVRPPYPVALRLYLIAAERWPEIDAAYASVDLMRLPTYRFLNCIWTWCVDRVPSDKREDWITQMNEPLPGRKVKRAPTQAELDADADTFMIALAAHGGGA
jgi:hypothetical protein